MPGIMALKEHPRYKVLYKKYISQYSQYITVPTGYYPVISDPKIGPQIYLGLKKGCGLKVL